MRVLLLSALLLPIAAALSAKEFLPLAANVSASGSISIDAVTGANLPAKLSEFGFFAGSAHSPSAQLIPYSLATPLFSDYSEKQRFVYLPMGTQVSVDDGYGRVTFPVGAAIVKSFGYPDGNGHLKVIETRVLLNRADGWVALPYVWNADGSDADLRIGGLRTNVTATLPDGKAQPISYAVPNKNQCKQCHSSSGQIQPIGPLLGNMRFPTQANKARFLGGANRTDATRIMPAWDNVQSATVAARAQSYLYVNCAHCHRPTGSASNSGLFFDETAIGPTAQGIGKHPVAAGRGSGGFEFVIAPGNPEQSILLHRLESLDPGVAMPELGRSSVHKEGADLLRQWIKEMPQS
jgi:uncharacterized repeat protein (TIGR03806 family)